MDESESKRREALGITAEQEARLTQIEEEVAKLESEYHDIVRPTPDEIQQAYDTVGDDPMNIVVSTLLTGIALYQDVLAGREAAYFEEVANGDDSGTGKKEG